MVSSTPEAEWDDEERAWMLALADYRASRCPNCGGDARECLDPETEGEWVVPPPVRCQARTAITIAQKPYGESPQPEALLFRAERKR